MHKKVFNYNPIFEGKQNILADTWLLCSFKQGIGWRVVATECGSLGTISVVATNMSKLLRMPSTICIRGGSFCNPRKILRKLFHSE